MEGPVPNVFSAKWGPPLYSAAGADDIPRIFAMRVKANTVEIRVDGIRVAARDLADAGYSAPLPSNSTLYVGRLQDGYNLNGRISALLVALRTTDAEVLLMEAYLRARYF